MVDFKEGKSNTWKIYLIIVINLCLLKIMMKSVIHSRSDNVEVMINDKEDEVIELFQSRLFRCQVGLKTLMKGSDFIFDCVD